MKNAPAVMGQHQKYVKHLEMQGWHGKEIDRDQLLQERAPGLGRWLVGTTMYLLELQDCLDVAPQADIDAASPCRA